MDGREGRYPTPLNVAEMAVEMLDPQPGERIMDCSSGTGTFWPRPLRTSSGKAGGRGHDA